MASEVIKLNIIPTGEMPVFHCSQFDNGRLINIELYRGEDAYTIPEGCTAELHCRKVDNNIVTIGSPVIDENTIKFTSTTQLTACNGKNLCEVAILGADDYLIGSLNFWLEVELDPLKGGITSTSEIHNLETQVEEITTEVIGENYYDKSEVDTLLADKADVSSVYTKTETDAKLALKANASSVYTKSETDTLLLTKADTSDVYTKGQVETKLAAKADAADVYTKSQVDSALALKADAADVYTKTQVDSALALKADADTTTAALATKADKSDTYTKEQVDALIDNIFPTLTASGVIASFKTALTKPLVSVTAAAGATTVTRCGVNLMHVNSRVSQTTAQVIYTSDDNYIYLNGTKSGGGYADMTNLTITLPAGDYYLKGFAISGTASNTVSLYGFNGSDNITGDILGGEKTLTLSETTTFRFRFAVWADGTVLDNYKIGIVISLSSISNYAEYNGQTVPVADATTLTTQSGVNNVFADTGNITVQYKYMSI